MLCCLFYLNHLQYMARFGLFDFLGLFASELFVFILQSSSAVLHFTLKACLTSDCPTLTRLCVCKLAKDARSTEKLPYVQPACFASLAVRSSRRSCPMEKSERYRELKDNGIGMIFSILIGDFWQNMIIHLG